MTNSRQKGKRGERAWRDELREAGFVKSYRGQQYQGGTDSPDVVCPELPNIHFEVKYTQKLDLYGAVLQAVTDSKGTDKVPVVAHKRNNCEWLVTMQADQWFHFVKDAGYAKTIFCPDCHDTHVRKDGPYLKGGHRYECLNENCKRKLFIA
jgi:Holliday junction resolvase